MAVYRRVFSRYEGALTGAWARLMVLPRYGWRELAKRRLVTIAVMAAMFWPLACAGFVYVANRADLLRDFGAEVPGFLTIDATFFVVFMNVQSTFAIILAALAGPGLLAADLAHGALPLYLSRPLSRSEYVAGRMLVLVGLLSVVTWIPGAFVFLMQVSMAGASWLAGGWSLGVAMLAGFLLWILLVSLVALASSAYVRWRIVAGAAVLGVFFVLGGAAELFNAVLRVEWASAFNPGRAMNQIWRAMLGADPLPGPGAMTCLGAVAVMVLVLALVLERRLRPVQVVS